MLNKKKLEFRCDYMFMYMCVKGLYKIIGQYPSPLDTVIQMIWDVRSLGLVWTHIEILGLVFETLLSFGGICMQYGDYKNTNIEIQMIHMRYNDTDAIWWYKWDIGL